MARILESSADTTIADQSDGGEALGVRWRPVWALLFVVASSSLLWLMIICAVVWAFG